VPEEAVTEAQWLICTDPEAMLDFLGGRVTERKVRLFACACVRRHWNAVADERSRRAIEVAERYADGLANEIERGEAWDEASSVVVKDALAIAAMYAVESDLEYVHGDLVQVGIARGVVREVLSRGGTEQAALSDLLRCVFGPRPFGTPPRVADTLRIWEHRTVPGLARTIYEEHAFDLLPVLADALEEAGCTDGIILDHLRGAGTHARGCFALDSCLLP
jgi:hypothetical protein